jgi:hypothetical protein
MDYDDLIKRLSEATKPDRGLDSEVARLVGFRRTSHNGQILWFREGSQEPVRIPNFTESIDRARELAARVQPDHVAGVTWENGKGSARIDGTPYCEAVLPAAALCMAIVHILKRRSEAT